MGFDNECILNIQSLAGEYFCPVCRLLVYPNEALQSQCTHLYCKPCLTYVVSTTRACPYDGYLVTEADSKPLTESNKALAETIGKIAVHCLYHRSGCTWQGPLSDCTSHCSGCAFGNSPVVCNRCGIQIVHRQVQEHAQNCPGVQPQVQQTEGVQDSAAMGTSAAGDQTQAVIQAGTTASQSQTSQTTAATTAGQDPNQQANSVPQGQAVAQAAAPTPEQWYQQQQQQYQQYYQQYPGYDPYQQQYQQYYPYHQQSVQQYQQQQPAHVSGQLLSQAYMQPQPQPQPQAQPQAQPQPQPQSQPQPQPQPQPLPHTQPQAHLHGQAPVAAQLQNQPQVNPQQQLHLAVQSHSQVQAQTHAPPHGHQPPQPQPYPQAQPHPMQPQPQPHLQMSQYQPHPQMQHPQPQPHPQHHPLPQSQPHSQAQPQTQLQHHPQPHPHPQPQLHSSQPNQPPNLNLQPQAQHPSSLSVTGHPSYPQPQAHQQLQLGTPQQHPMHTHPQTGPHQQPQHPVQMQSQFPQQPAQMRPPQSHAPIANQQQPALLPSPGQVPNIPPTQQMPVHPHAQQPGHPVHQHPGMLSNQQPIPQQYVQQQQQLPFPGQPSGSVQNQLHPQGTFVQPPIQAQMRPQGPPSSLQQHSHAYPQPQQNVALSHGMQPYQSQNHFGRPLMSGAQQFPQSPGGLAGAGQVRPLSLGANQPSANHYYPPRTNSQVQSSSEQQLGYMQSGPTSKSTMLERQGDQLSEKSVIESSSQRTAKNGANNLVTGGNRADSVEIKTVKSETDIKPMDDEHKSIGEDEDKTSRAGTSGGEISESMRKLGTDLESHAMENGEPVIKQMVKEEVSDGKLEPSAGGKSVENLDEDQKDVLNISPKQVDHSLLEEKEIREQAEVLEEQNRKLQNDAVDAGGVVQPSVVNKGSQAVLPTLTPILDTAAQSVVTKGPIPESGKMLHQHGYLERNLPQAQVTQGPGGDEYRSFPPPGQVQGRGFVQPSHPVPITDQGNHQPQPIHYGPAPSMLQPMPPGPPHHGPFPGHPPTQLRSQGPGQLAQPGQHLNPPDHFQPPGGIAGPGSTASFGRGPSHFGPPQRSFDPQSGHVPPSHPGLPRFSQGEPVGGPPLGALHPGSFDSHGGMMVRAPPPGPEGQMGQQRLNPMEAEMFPNQRPGYLDGRQPDSHLPLERSPFQPSGIQPNATRMNGAPGLDSSALGLRDERFKPLPRERLNTFPMEPGRHIIDRGEFEEDLKQFPRPSRLDAEPVSNFGNYFAPSRPIDRGHHGYGMDAARMALDKAPHGFNYDAGLKLDPSASSAPSRFLPPYQPGSMLRPNDAGERPRPVGLHDDNVGGPDSARTHPEFLGPVPGYGRHHMDGLTSRSPVREYPGIPSRGFGSGVPGNQSGLEDIDGRELHRFGEGSKPFNLPSDVIGNSFHESRFPILPSHLRRGELEGTVNLPMGEHIASGQDILPGHLRRGEHLGPRNMPGYLRLGEPAGFGPFPGHSRFGELTGPGNFPQHPTGEPFGVGNKPSHPRFGEPGFRSSYSLQGYPNDGGFYMGDMESFDNPRKRKPPSMGWCRICKVDCETVEGLDLHSQTREHQKMAMDMVLRIKQQNAKKQKLTSNDHSSVEDASKSRNANFEGRRNKH